MRSIHHAIGLLAALPTEGFIDPSGDFVRVTEKGGHERRAKPLVNRLYPDWEWWEEPAIKSWRPDAPYYTALLYKGWIRVTEGVDRRGVSLEVWTWQPRMKADVEKYLVEMGMPESIKIEIEQLQPRRFSQLTVGEFFDEGPWRSQLRAAVKRLSQKIEEIGILPDGSGFGTMSFPLPEDHWSFSTEYEEPPAPFRMGTSDPRKSEWAEKITEAGKYAYLSADLDDPDHDPDAYLQNLVVGLLGYWTDDGYSSDSVTHTG